MREVKLPSGALLKVAAAPFTPAKALYQALLREAKGVQISSNTEIPVLYKDIFCAGFSSQEVEKCMWECFKSCLYNSGAGDFRITDQTFEPVAARDDYISVCVEVTKENVLPFGKSLFAECQRILAMINNVQA